MKVTIIESFTDVNSKTGEFVYGATVLGVFSDYGKHRKSTATVKLTAETIKRFDENIGKDLNLDFIIPKPTYPLELS